MGWGLGVYHAKCFLRLQRRNPSLAFTMVATERLELYKYTFPIYI